MDNRAMILSNAVQLFASRSYDAVGVQEIASRSGVTKPTLYYYFGSKRGLLEAILIEYGGRLFQVIREAARYQGDIVINLQALTAGYFQFAREHAGYYRMQLTMYFAPPESEPNRMVRPMNEAQHHVIAELFRQAAGDQAMKGEGFGCAAAFIGTINTYIGFALNGYLELNQKLVHHAVDQFLHGIYQHSKPGEVKMKNLNGKVVVVTGAGSGIGRALAYRLSMEKAVLALADIDEEGLQITKRLIGADLGDDSARIYQVDVARREQVYEFARRIMQDFGKVDLMINNTGFSSSGRAHEQSYNTREWALDINLWGVIHGTKAFLPHLMERPEAGIVNVSSVYGLLGIPGQAAYCTSKFALWVFVESLRQELIQTNIFVTQVFPGGIKTNIAQNSRIDYQFDEADYQRGLQQFETTLKTQPETAADAIIYGVKHKSPRVLIGKDARQMDFLARFIPNSYDKVIAKHLQTEM